MAQERPPGLTLDGVGRTSNATLYLNPGDDRAVRACDRLGIPYKADDELPVGRVLVTAWRTVEDLERAARG